METTELQTQALTVLEQAKAMPAVTTDEGYAQVGEFILACKQLIAKITSAHAESIEAAHRSHKAAIALRDSHIQPINAALALAQPLALEYKREQDKKAAVEAARIAEEQRQAREAAKLKEAETLEAWGETDAANAKLAEAITPIRQTKVESILPKVSGLSTRKQWKFRITQPSKVNRAYCAPDQTLCNRAVQSFYAYNKNPTAEQVQALVDEIGGGEIYEEEVFAGRVAR